MYSYPEDEIAERYNFLGRDLALSRREWTREAD
jgi:hypothetical protein